METSTEPSNIFDSIQGTLRVQNAGWTEECNRFLLWERQEMILKDPSPATKACHRRSLEFLLKMTDNMQKAVSEPELFEAKLQSNLAVLHQRLLVSWEKFYNPMPEEEADRILARIFPE